MSRVNGIGAFLQLDDFESYIEYLRYRCEFLTDKETYDIYYNNIIAMVSAHETNKKYISTRTLSNGQICFILMEELIEITNSVVFSNYEKDEYEKQLKYMKRLNKIKAVLGDENV